MEQYVKWVQVLRKRGYTVDGIVLTEHRKFDFDKDYSALAEQYRLMVLKGSELDTRYGHFLVYGVNEGLTSDLDFSDVRMDARELMRAARQHDAVAIPAHPGRFGIGLTEYIKKGESFADVDVVELLNGGGRAGENERADELCQQFGYLGIGGSDAHLTSHIATCMTEFRGRHRQRAPVGRRPAQQAVPAGATRSNRRRRLGLTPGRLNRDYQDAWGHNPDNPKIRSILVQTSKYLPERKPHGIRIELRPVAARQRTPCRAF